MSVQQGTVNTFLVRSIAAAVSFPDILKCIPDIVKRLVDLLKCIEHFSSQWACPMYEYSCFMCIGTNISEVCVCVNEFHICQCERSTYMCVRFQYLSETFSEREREREREREQKRETNKQLSQGYFTCVIFYLLIRSSKLFFIINFHFMFIKEV